MVVERGTFRKEIVGADDGGVAASVAAADPALLEHGDVGEPVLAGEVVGGAESVTAAADDECVVRRFGLGVTPLRLPATLARESPAQQREAGKALHDWILQFPAGGDVHPRARHFE